jgi:hypothetical protein
VLVTCGGTDAAVRLGFPAASAAIARRKTMIVVDLTASDGLAGELTSACRAAAAPLTEFRPVAPGSWAPARQGGRASASGPAGGPAAGRQAGSHPADEVAAGARLAAALGQAVRDREAVLAGLDPAMPSQGAARAAERAVSILTAVLRHLHEQGLRGDCLVWIHGCEVARPAALAGLLELGPGTGTAVLLSTASPSAAAALAGRMAAVVAGGPADARVADSVAAWSLPGAAGADAAGTAAARAERAARLRRQPASQFTIVDREGGIRPACRPVPQPGVLRQVVPRRPAAPRPAPRRPVPPAEQP